MSASSDSRAKPLVRVITPVDARPLVSILTPTIPERKHLLQECECSIAAQTFRDFEWIMMEDREREGCSVVMNRCAARAEGEWLLPLADDDLLLPGALTALTANAVNADIIYSPPLVTGNADRWWFYQEPPVIPATALIRRELWNQLGGYDETLSREEDRHMWIAALDAGARFVRVDYPCWVYRQHSSNKSFAQAA